jgi:hypothetical protein
LIFFIYLFIYLFININKQLLKWLLLKWIYNKWSFIFSKKRNKKKAIAETICISLVEIFHLDPSIKLEISFRTTCTRRATVFVAYTGFEFGQSHVFCEAKFGQSVFPSKINQWVEIWWQWQFLVEKKNQSNCLLTTSAVYKRSYRTFFWHVQTDDSLKYVRCNNLGWFDTDTRLQFSCSFKIKSRAAFIASVLLPCCAVITAHLVVFKDCFFLWCSNTGLTNLLSGGHHTNFWLLFYFYAKYPPIWMFLGLKHNKIKCQT